MGWRVDQSVIFLEQWRFSPPVAILFIGMIRACSRSFRLQAYPPRPSKYAKLCEMRREDASLIVPMKTAAELQRTQSGDSSRTTCMQPALIQSRFGAADDPHKISWIQ
jgi:hypothetical protein